MLAKKKPRAGIARNGGHAGARNPGGAGWRAKGFRAGVSGRYSESSDAWKAAAGKPPRQVPGLGGFAAESGKYITAHEYFLEGFNRGAEAREKRVKPNRGRGSKRNWLLVRHTDGTYEVSDRPKPQSYVVRGFSTYAAAEKAWARLMKTGSVKPNRGRVYIDPKSTNINRKVRRAMKRGAMGQARYKALQSKYRYRKLHPAVNPGGTKSTQFLYQKAVEADDRFQAALERAYGGRAGDVRYQPGKQTAAIRALANTYKRAAEAWRKALKRENPGAFERCVKEVAARGRAYSPRGVCATAGRKKYGAKKFAQMAAAGKRRAARKRSNPANPEDAAAERFEFFHGRPPADVFDVTTKIHEHGVLSGIGKLKALVISAVDGSGEVTLSKFRGALLAQNEAGTQLFIEGGDQSVRVSDFIGRRDPHETETLGPVLEVVYSTQKDHLRPEDGGKGDYHHKFGKRGTLLPLMIYDVVNKLLKFSGGGYDLPEVGIRG